MWYDVSIFIVEVAILIAVVVEAWISWQALQEKRKTRIKGIVTKTLTKLRIAWK